MTSNNSDFKKLAAEADNERKREMKSRAEAQLLKLEHDRQNHEDEAVDKPCNSTNYTSNISVNSVISDSTISSKYNSRPSSVEPSQIDIKIKILEEQNKEYKLSYIQSIDEKETLSYQIGLISDQMDDLNETLRNTQRELAEKRKTCSYQKCQIEELTNRLNFLKYQIDIRDQLIIDNNLMVTDEVDFAPDSKPGENISENKINDDNDENSSNKIIGTALLSKDLIDQLKELSETSLENCIRKLLEQRQSHQDDIKTLQQKLNEEKDDSDIWNKKSGDKKKRGDCDYETLKQNLQNVKNQCQEYKRQLQISQQKVTALESDVIRLEGQVKRHKSIAESCEKQEEELKQAKRKYQREFREAQNKIEDLKSENGTLLKKLEKFTKQKTKKEIS